MLEMLEMLEIDLPVERDDDVGDKQV